MPEQNRIKKASGRVFYLKAILLMLIPAVASRLLYFVHSYLITDITVPPALSSVLNYLFIAMTCVMCGAAYASITAGVYSRSAFSGIVVLLIFTAIFFVDCSVRFASDYIGGEVRYREIVGIITLLMEFFSQAAMAMCAWMISVAFHHLHELSPAKRIYRKLSAAFVAISIHFLVPLVRWIATVLAFLREVDFIPTSAELVSVFTDLAVIVVFYGAVSLAAGAVSLRIMTKNDKIKTIS